MASWKQLTHGPVRFPIIVILGSTGVGKSKLGIELSKRLNGEVISADSMQVYKGLDVITAKVTEAEQAQCKHHMINIVEPLEKFNIVDFRNMALPVIQDITKRGKVPIVVGGTNYYIESLLWEILVSEENVGDVTASQSDFEECIGRNQPKASDLPNLEHRYPLEGNRDHTESPHEKQEEKSVPDSPKESLCCKNDCSISEDGQKLPKNEYEYLKTIDPIAASRVHPNDSRKVKRQLQIYELTGRLPSEVVNEQKSKEGADHLGGPLRFTNALVFWLTCEQEVLNKRLCDRVDEMVVNGLVGEISGFYDEYDKILAKRKSSTEPYTEGIFQAIGFKEFHDYLTRKDVDEDKSKQLLKEGIDALKRVTIRYSKKQKTWVRNRFLKRPEFSSPNVYQLDASDIVKWYQTVLEPALKVAKAFLVEEEIDIKPVPRISKDPEEDVHKHYHCEACDEKLIVGDHVWMKHCKSRKHKKRLARKRKLENSG